MNCTTVDLVASHYLGTGCVNRPVQSAFRRRHVTDHCAKIPRGVASRVHKHVIRDCVWGSLRVKGEPQDRSREHSILLEAQLPSSAVGSCGPTIPPNRLPWRTLIRLNSVIVITIASFRRHVLHARIPTALRTSPRPRAMSATVKPLPLRRPESHQDPPAHHIGKPPTSFQNPWPSYSGTTLTGFLSTRFNSPKNFVPIPADRVGLVEVRKPDFGVGKDGLKATWIGHASFLIETAKAKGADRGMRILLDPVWSERMGPYGRVGPIRFTPVPCLLEDLPEIDAVCISHDHYDHLDSDTLKKLNTRHNGKLKFFCGLNVKAVLTGLGIGIKAEQVTELDWWDAVHIDIDGVSSTELVCTPAQHRSGRTPWNFDGTLWCSWIIKETSEDGKRLFFAGDTGYCHVTSNDEPSHHNAPYPPCPAFAEIGELYGPFDLALLPIGCFQPRSLLSGQHSSPDDSIAIHKDVRSKKSIGMHYGTIRGGISGSYEPVTEPVQRFKKAAEAEGLQWGDDVGLCDVGETVIV